MANLASDKNLDKHLKIIKSGEEITSLELATEGNGARIKGDLELTGSIVSPVGYLNLQGEGIIINSGKLNFEDYTNYIKFENDAGTGVNVFYITTESVPMFSLFNQYSTGDRVAQFVLDGGTITTADAGANVYNSVLKVKQTLNDTVDSGTTVHKLIEGIMTNTDITGWDELYLLHLTGAGTFYIDNAGNVALSATAKLLFDGGGHTYISETSDDVLDFYVGADKMLTLDEANDKITMGATNWVAGTVSGATVTEFSAANSAYAGMILGYTCLLNDAADTSYNVTTSFVTVDSTAKVTFTAPPSGNVEIFASVFCKWSTNRWLQFGLSDNATYNAVDVTHEHFIGEGDETDEMQINHRWVITGLTAGTSYTYYLGAKAEQASRVYLYWGGDATGEYAPLIMKATALPATIYDGT